MCHEETAKRPAGGGDEARKQRWQIEEGPRGERRSELRLKGRNRRRVLRDGMLICLSNHTITRTRNGCYLLAASFKLSDEPLNDMLHEATDVFDVVKGPSTEVLE